MNTETKTAGPTARTVVIVPCSGIGKTYGSVTREAAYIVSEELRPETTTIVPLSLLVLGDEEARSAVRDAAVITVDGCKLACATLNVGEAGGAVAQEFIVLDCYRRHRELKPKGISQLSEGGLALARVLAEEVVGAIDELDDFSPVPPGSPEFLAAEELQGTRGNSEELRVAEPAVNKGGANHA